MAFQDWEPREHLSAFAMIGILASDHEQRFNAESVAEQSLEVADALMAAVRSPRKPSPSPDLQGELVAICRELVDLGVSADHMRRLRAVLAKLPASNPNQEG